MEFYPLFKFNQIKVTGIMSSEPKFFMNEKRNAILKFDLKFFQQNNYSVPVLIRDYDKSLYNLVLGSKISVYGHLCTYKKALKEDMFYSKTYVDLEEVEVFSEDGIGSNGVGVGKIVSDLEHISVENMTFDNFKFSVQNNEFNRPTVLPVKLKNFNLNGHAPLEKGVALAMRYTLHPRSVGRHEKNLVLAPYCLKRVPDGPQELQEKFFEL